MPDADAPSAAQPTAADDDAAAGSEAGADSGPGAGAGAGVDTDTREGSGAADASAATSGDPDAGADDAVAGDAAADVDDADADAGAADADGAARADARRGATDTELGRGIVVGSWVGTGAFVGLASVAAAFPDEAASAVAAVDVGLFAVGVVAFLLAYARAVSRSRTDAIGIGGLFFLAGGVAPRNTQRQLLGAFAIQAATAIVTSSIRPYTAVAFGILVPMFGLGLAGLWGARHGTFPAREQAT